VDPDILGRLFMLWRHSPDENSRLVASFALAYQPLAPRDDVRRFASIPKTELLSQIQDYEQMEVNSPDFVKRFGKSAALIVAWYLRAPWSDAELVDRARALLKESGPHVAAPTLHTLLEHLSEKP
jgi:hypothetical protein